MTNQPQPGDIGVFEDNGLKTEVRYMGFERGLHTIETPFKFEQFLHTETFRWGERLRVEPLPEPPEEFRIDAGAEK